MSYSGNLVAFEATVALFKKQNRDFTVERSGRAAVIYIEGRELKFFEKQKDPSVPVLCKKVNSDARKFLKENPLDPVPYRSVVHYNLSEIKRCMYTDIIGYDINACYWNIAYREGYISLETYLYGKENKSARLVAIGNLKKRKEQIKYVSGTEIKTDQENNLGLIWDHIIYEVHQMYLDVLEIVGSCFVAWCTDCLYVSKSFDPEIENYFKSKSLTVKKEAIKLNGIQNNIVRFYNYKKERDSYWQFSFQKEFQF